MSDLIQFNCPACSAALEADQQSAGSFVECDQCGGPVQIPDLKSVADINSSPLPPRTFWQRNKFLFLAIFGTFVFVAVFVFIQLLNGVLRGGR